MNNSFIGLINRGSAMVLVSMAAGISAHGAIITLGSSNASGSTGFSAGAGWPGGVAPQAGNDYVVEGAKLLRTADNSGANHTFGGDSLTIGTGASLGYKGGNNAGLGTSSDHTITVNNLILNGGSITNIANGTGSGSGVLTKNFTLAGNLSLGALGGTIGANSQSEGAVQNNKNVTVSANISGSGPLVLTNVQNSGRPVIQGFVTLSGTNNHTGGTTVSDYTTVVVTGASGFGSGGNVRVLPTGQLDLRTATAFSATAGGAAHSLLLGSGMLPGSIKLDFEGETYLASISFDGGLTFGGAGIYDASHSSGLFSGTGKLVVVPEVSSALLLMAGISFLGARRRTV